MEATVFLGLTREQHGAPGTLVYEISELPSRTRDGRFSFVWPASTAHAERGSLASLRAVPESPDYGDAATPSVRIEKGETRAKHELAVERVGMGTAVVTATKPSGAPFEGTLDVRLVSQVGTFGQRETTIAREADGLFRIAVPADRSWMAWIQPSRVPGESGYYAATRRVSLRVAAGETVTVAVVLPGMGRVRVRSPRERGFSILFEPLGAERSGSMTVDMSAIVPDEEGHLTAVSEGRWRVTRKGDREDLVREVEVRDGEEAALDLR